MGGVGGGDGGEWEEMSSWWKRGVSRVGAVREWWCREGVEGWDLEREAGTKGMRNRIRETRVLE